MQLILALASLVAFALIYFFLPETSHPGARGIDKFLLTHPEVRHKGRVGFKWINPLVALELLRSPNLLALVSRRCRRIFVYPCLMQVQSLSGLFVLLTDHGKLFFLRRKIFVSYRTISVLLTPLAYNFVSQHVFELYTNSHSRT
jgi:hypothetical protein